ncbi:DUF4124 domain-containing protein [Variovorax sp. J22P240]|uniref:DUF4124 domain-containing protein n=1 Tax=Variovorax sp. J22P240 TaxID=3053514 RepID=UPI0025787108|nr:DUF4124 domain-containing protein [Variovorax sp. J22P240]MDL9999866.1 DUF4124 domain-containing protein [Variovorax sp. J22P240]
MERSGHIFPIKLRVSERKLWNVTGVFGINTRIIQARKPRHVSKPARGEYRPSMPVFHLAWLTSTSGETGSFVTDCLLVDAVLKRIHGRHAYDAAKTIESDLMPLPIPRLAKTITVLIIAAASAATSAEVHRCKDEKGQTTLSDRPCGAAFSGQYLNSTTSGTDRIAAPAMVRAQTRDLASQYGFVGELATRARSKTSSNQAQK